MWIQIRLCFQPGLIIFYYIMIYQCDWNNKVELALSFSAVINYRIDNKVFSI